MSSRYVPLLPAEIWLRIIDHVPAASRFELTRTSRDLHALTVPYVRRLALFSGTTTAMARPGSPGVALTKGGLSSMTTATTMATGDEILAYLGVYGRYVRAMQLPLRAEVAFDDDLVEGALALTPHLDALVLESSCSERQVAAVLSETPPSAVICLLQHVRRDVRSAIHADLSARSTVVFGCCDALLIHPSRLRSITLAPDIPIVAQLGDGLLTIKIPEECLVDTTLARTIIDHAPGVRDIALERATPDALVILVRDCRTLLSLRAREKGVTASLVAQVVRDVKPRVAGVHISSTTNIFYDRFWHFLLVPCE